jgi:hypothetical protein
MIINRTTQSFTFNLQQANQINNLINQTQYSGTSSLFFFCQSDPFHRSTNSKQNHFGEEQITLLVATINKLQDLDRDYGK